MARLLADLFFGKLEATLWLSALQRPNPGPGTNSGCHAKDQENRHKTREQIKNQAPEKFEKEIL